MLPTQSCAPVLGSYHTAAPRARTPLNPVYIDAAGSGIGQGRWPALTSCTNQRSHVCNAGPAVNAGAAVESSLHATPHEMTWEGDWQLAAGMHANGGAPTMAVHVERSDGVGAHDGRRQRVIGAQVPGVVLLQQPPGGENASHLAWDIGEAGTRRRQRLQQTVAPG